MTPRRKTVGKAERLTARQIIAAMLDESRRSRREMRRIVRELDESIAALERARRKSA